MQVRRREKVAIFALVAARVIYATNWLNIGAIFKLMETTLGVGVIGLGDVTSSFYLGLGLVQIPAGVLAARVGPKRVVVSGVVLYSLATLGVAASSSLAQVVALRFVVGSGMALVFAPAVVLVAKLFGGKSAGVGVGVFNSAYDLGGLLGLYAWIVVATAAGWQTSLLLSGAIGGLTALLVLVLVPGDETSLEFRVRRSALLGILMDSQLILLGLGALALTVGNVLISNFMVYYLNSSLDVPLPTAGLVTALVVVIPIATALWGGRLYDRTRRPKVLMLLSCGGMFVALLLASIPDLAVAALGTAVGGVVSGVGFTTAFAWARDLNRAEVEYDGLAIAWVNGISLTGAFIPSAVYSLVAGAWGYSASWLAGGVLCLALTVPVFFQNEGIPVRAA
ncbi:MAG TPA: MFS transporter [Nitrososphaerales archaeon]|nr:MFS transporter [Nitrososphaerales archaeon]